MKLNYNVTNGIHCHLPTFAQILIIDLTKKDDQVQTVPTEHNRASILYKNSCKISKEHYFPNLKRMVKKPLWH